MRILHTLLFMTHLSGFVMQQPDRDRMLWLWAVAKAEAEATSKPEPKPDPKPGPVVDSMPKLKHGDVGRVFVTGAETAQAVRLGSDEFGWAILTRLPSGEWHADISHLEKGKHYYGWIAVTENGREIRKRIDFVGGTNYRTSAPRIEQPTLQYDYPPAFIQGVFKSGSWC